jgi:hypothetical protein
VEKRTRLRYAAPTGSVFTPTQSTGSLPATSSAGAAILQAASAFSLWPQERTLDPRRLAGSQLYVIAKARL